MTWQYHLVRFNGDGTKTFLNHELPLSGVEITNTLTGPDRIRCKVEPEFQYLQDSSGRPVFEEWSTGVFAEEGGQIRGGAILETMTETGSTLQLDFLGLAGYPYDMPYTSEKIAYQTDPLDLFRLAWDHLQGKSGGNLGLVMDRGAKTPIRLGIPEDPDLTFWKKEETKWKTKAEAAKKAVKNAELDYDAARVLLLECMGKPAKGKVYYQDSKPGTDEAKSTNNVWIDKNDGKKAYVWSTKDKDWVLSNGDPKFVKPTKPYRIVDRVDYWLKCEANVDKAKKASTEANKDASWATSQRAKIKGGEADPFVWAYYQTHNLGQELDELARDTPFDYRVDHSWEGNDIRSYLNFGYPTLGRRRHDIRLVLGENVFEVPTLEYNGEDYADEVMVLGAGEGRKMIRATATRPSRRLRRVAVVVDKSLRSSGKALGLATNEVKERLGDVDITELVLANHPSSKLGTIDLGDEVEVQTTDSWTRELVLWCRVMAIKIEPGSERTTLSLARVEKVT